MKIIYELYELLSKFDCDSETLIEQKIKNNEPFPFNIDEIDFMLLTHAHIDHSGRIPKLYKEGLQLNTLKQLKIVILIYVMVMMN